MRVGFVGLGAMGAPMALHLARAGRLQAVWNRTRARAQEFGREHRIAAPEHLPDLARACDVVLLCVSADRDVAEVSRALLAGMASGGVLIDTSTISPSTTRALAAEAARSGVAWLDAPLTGGVEGARAGRLAVMVGGEEAVLDRVRPVLECFAARITHMGPVGAGQACKAINQVMVAGIAEGVCEALALAERMGLPQDRLLAVLTAGAAHSWFLEKRGASMLRDDFTPGFKLGLLRKDLEIVQALAEELGAELPVVNQALADYRALQAAGYGDEEISALIRRKRALFTAP